ncbi:MAG: polysaccharide biosynthesis protein [Candidatus Latescibacteria bacterium]|jgi:FlaA1/EpsC-like NDP-sugar epimerase|nr:polysaccharide biosynthesis protein [Candidatus Latescibacterota bacterium]
MGFFTDKVVLITGAAGTVGRELIRQLIDLNPREIRAIDINESEVFFLDQDFIPLIKKKSTARKSSPIRFLATVGDIRDSYRIEQAFRGVDIVLHAAALKHVILCERSPFEAVQTNIVGVNNVIRAAAENSVERVIFMSSDKAVNPTNVMGTSKLMGERLISTANSIHTGGKTIFSSTRFGNVIGSHGSVAPIFMKQIRNGGPVTLTNRCMTRFFMTVEQSAQLVLTATELACGGEVFVTKMPSMRIEDLATTMIKMHAPKFGIKPDSIEIVQTGVKDGEKLYEELMSMEENERAMELDKMFVILPFRLVREDITYEYPNCVSDVVNEPYLSNDRPPMTLEEIESFLQDYFGSKHFTSREDYIPEEDAEEVSRRLEELGYL